MVNANFGDFSKNTLHAATCKLVLIWNSAGTQCSVVTQKNKTSISIRFSWPIDSLFEVTEFETKYLSLFNVTAKK